MIRREFPRAESVTEPISAGPIEERGRITNLDALRSMIPDTVGSIPAKLGFTALLFLWNKHGATWLHRRVLTYCGMESLRR